MSPATLASAAVGRYTTSAFRSERFPTREVKVGDVGVGGSNPIRLQSMTIADTMNTQAVVEEAIALFQAGAEIVRVTAPSKQDAQNIQNIRAGIRGRGFSFPLCADIHFAPQAALIAVEHAEKVRINPGNFADSKRFKTREYTDREYEEELERIHDVFRPLVLRAAELGRAMRIGANHGSLSDRILNRYGDTPAGMVESALEFIRIARQYNYHDIIVSMKASNPVVMVQAYRLLVECFRNEGMNYPLHLGVTEAGNGRDARIKSSVGIGSLLEDGIGDTIRVSLTEDSVHELPPARMIARRAVRSGPGFEAPEELERLYTSLVNPYEFARRGARGIELPDVGGSPEPRKAAPVRLAVSVQEASATGTLVDGRLEGVASELRALGTDLILARGDVPRTVRDHVVPVGETVEEAAAVYHIEVDPNAWTSAELLSQIDRTLDSIGRQCRTGAILSIGWTSSVYVKPLKTDVTHLYRLLFSCLRRRSGADLFPLLARISCATEEEALYAGGLHGGGLLLDGIADGILIEVEALAEAECARIGLDILQSVRLRMSKAEFISCPSCGRTLFDLQETTARIKARTGHLKGVKIAVMGCIVNGPGEMADADFGYVGAGPGHVHLYREKELVKPNVPSALADLELENLIREHGMWVEP